MPRVHEEGGGGTKTRGGRKDYGLPVRLPQTSSYSRGSNSRGRQDSLEAAVRAQTLSGEQYNHSNAGALLRQWRVRRAARIHREDNPATGSTDPDWGRGKRDFWSHSSHDLFIARW